MFINIKKTWRENGRRKSRGEWRECRKHKSAIQSVISLKLITSFSALIWAFIFWSPLYECTIWSLVKLWKPHLGNGSGYDFQNWLNVKLNWEKVSDILLKKIKQNKEVFADCN